MNNLILWHFKNLTNQNNPADIHFHGSNPGTLAIPNSGNNSVNLFTVLCFLFNFLSKINDKR